MVHFSFHVQVLAKAHSEYFVMIYLQVNVRDGKMAREVIEMGTCQRQCQLSQIERMEKNQIGESEFDIIF